VAVLCGIYGMEEVWPKVYMATAEIQVRNEGAHAMQSDDSFDATHYEAELAILQSPDILLPVIRELGLDKNWAKRLAHPNQDLLSDKDALSYLQQSLKSEILPGTNIIKITVASENPQEAAAIANAIADRFKTMRQAQEDQRYDRGMNSLSEQVAHQQKVMDEKKTAVDKLRSELKLKGLLLTPGDQLMQELYEREKDLRAAEGDYNARWTLEQEFKGLPDEEFIHTLDADGLPDGNVPAVRKEIHDMQVEVNGLLKDGLAPTHPRVVAFQAAIARKQQQIKNLIAAIKKGMQIDVDTAEARLALLQKEVDALKAQAPPGFSPELNAYRQAFREFEEAQSLLDALNMRLKQVTSDKFLLEQIKILCTVFRW